MRFARNSLLLIAIVAAIGQAAIQVVTSIPDIADIVKEVGGSDVEVFSLAQGTEDIHAVQVKSSFLPKLNRAQLLICLGLDAESFWLVPLAESARNDFIRKGHPGWIEAYKGVALLEKPDAADTAKMAGGHKQGNPHINSGPYCGKFMAKNVYDALLLVDRAHAAAYEQRYTAYVAKLDKMEQTLKERAAPLRGIKVITYHADMSYFCKFFGMQMYGTLEPAPGLAPTSQHMARLIDGARRDQVQLVLYHQAQNPRLPATIAEKVGAKTVCFGNMVQSRPEIRSFIDLQNYNLDLMLKALKTP